MPEFQLKFPPAELNGLAERYTYEDDAAAQAAGASARNRGYYAREEFLLICSWKTNRSQPKVVANSPEAIEEATRTAFAAHQEGTRMEALLALQGVGIPTASALLHFAFPDDYPILDVRALESLGHKSRTVYPVSFWLAYLAACRSLAQKHGVTIRTLDKALWQYSHELE